MHILDASASRGLCQQLASKSTLDTRRDCNSAHEDQTIDMLPEKGGYNDACTPAPVDTDLGDPDPDKDDEAGTARVDSVVTPLDTAPPHVDDDGDKKKNKD